MNHLDDIHQSVIVIPFDTENDERVEYPPCLDGDDAPDVARLRWTAYCAAWTKILTQTKSILESLYTPFINDILEHIDSAYKDPLAGLPYTELPVLVVSNISGDATVWTNLISSLKRKTLTDHSNAIYVSEVYASNCSNLQSCMSAIISDFLDRPADRKKGKRKSRYVDYDVELLKEWHSGTDGTNLVIIMHDFEQFDPLVVQDLFEVFSSCIPELPVAFILCLSTPESPSSFLCSLLPRSILSLLRLHSFSCPSGVPILETILKQIFFDPSFQPDICIGPTALEFIIDHFERCNPSVAMILSAIQITYLKHFSVNNLAVLGAQDLPRSPLPFTILDAVLRRLQSHGINQQSEIWTKETVQNVVMVEALNTARLEFSLRVCKLRLGFQILNLLDEFFVAHLPSRPGFRIVDDGPLKLMVLTMKGKLEKYIARAKSLFKQLSNDKVVMACDELSQFYNGLPESIHREEDVAWGSFLKYASNPMGVDSAEQIAGWLSDYLGILTAPLENVPLWDIWYTGLSPFPEELFNPSIRASILSGLTRPQEFTFEYANIDPKLWELPDTSVIFQGYLESGQKLINVYDWYESFKLAVESQERRGKGKGKKNGKLGPDDEREVQVQARYMRALHELELLGFTKPTKRKADHILRTIFDVPDE